VPEKKVQWKSSTDAEQPKSGTGERSAESCFLEGEFRNGGAILSPNSLSHRKVKAGRLTGEAVKPKKSLLQKSSGRRLHSEHTPKASQNTEGGKSLGGKLIMAKTRLAFPRGPATRGGN